MVIADFLIKLTKGLFRQNMATSVGVIAKKIFSLSLIFNSLISFACVAGIIFGYYQVYPRWQPYAPYLLDGTLFWIVLAAALINIFPSASLGRTLHTGRFLFHHYVYGFFVLLSTAFLVTAFTSFSVFNLFFIDNSTVEVNTARVFVLAGLTLFLDDLPDVSRKVESLLNGIKAKAYHVRKALHVFQLFTGLVCLYACISIILWTTQTGERAAPNTILTGTLLITSLTSFALVKKKVWLKMTPVQPFSVYV